MKNLTEAVFIFAAGIVSTLIIVIAVSGHSDNVLTVNETDTNITFNVQCNAPFNLSRKAPMMEYQRGEYRDGSEGRCWIDDKSFGLVFNQQELSTFIY